MNMLESKYAHFHNNSNINIINNNNNHSYWHIIKPFKSIMHRPLVTVSSHLTDTNYFFIAHIVVHMLIFIKLNVYHFKNKYQRIINNFYLTDRGFSA